jgi:hypothetical protein
MVSEAGEIWTEAVKAQLKVLRVMIADVQRELTVGTSQTHVRNVTAGANFFHAVTTTTTTTTTTTITTTTTTTTTTINNFSLIYVV